jgi:hypothetical protein
MRGRGKWIRKCGDTNWADDFSFSEPKRLELFLRDNTLKSKSADRSGLKNIIMRMKGYVFLLLSMALAALSPGCASTAPTDTLITAQRNPDFSPARTDTICLSQQLDPRPEDAALRSALTAELARENFNIVTNTDADYTLAGVIEDDSTVEPVRQTTPAYTYPNPMLAGPFLARPMTPEGQENTGEPSLESATVQTDYVHVNSGIRLYLFANPKKHPGMQIAWEGCIAAGKTVSAEREPLLVKTLLGYFGKDYNGRVGLNK